MNGSRSDDYDCSWQRKREIKKLVVSCAMGWNHLDDLQHCAGIAVHGESDGCSGGQPLRRGLLPHTHQQRKPPPDELHETGLQRARPQVGLMHTSPASPHNTGHKRRTRAKMLYLFACVRHPFSNPVCFFLLHPFFYLKSFHMCDIRLILQVSCQQHVSASCTNKNLC